MNKHITCTYHFNNLLKTCMNHVFMFRSFQHANIKSRINMILPTLAAVAVDVSIDISTST